MKKYKNKIFGFMSKKNFVSVRPFVTQITKICQFFSLLRHSVPSHDMTQTLKWLAETGWSASWLTMALVQL